MHTLVFCGLLLVAALLLAPLPAAASAGEWDLYMNYFTQSSPAAFPDDSLVAVGAEGPGDMFAFLFNPDGDKLAQWPFEGKPACDPVISDMPFTYGDVFVGETMADGTGKVSSFDNHNCSTKWAYPTSAPVVTELANFCNELYFGTGDGTLHNINIANNGNSNWTKQLGQTATFTNSPTVGPGCVFIGVWDTNSNQALLYLVDRKDGKSWVIATGNSPFVGSPSYCKDYDSPTGGYDLFTKTEAGDLVSVHFSSSSSYGPWGGYKLFAKKDAADLAHGDIHGRRNGPIKWIYHPGPGGSPSPAAGENGFRPRASNTAAPVSSPSIDVDGAIYFGMEDGTFHAVNPDGTQKWTYQAGGPIKSSPAIGADGIIYFGCNDGHLYLLRRDGILIVKVQYGGAIEASPTLTKSGKLYFGSADGYLHAVPLTAGLAESPWPMYRKDPQHTAAPPKPELPFLPLLLLSRDYPGTLAFSQWGWGGLY